MKTEDKIQHTMTVREAAALWEDSQRKHLGRWGELFGIRLMEFHIGHVNTYQVERGREVPASVVNVEVDALLALLKQANLGTEIVERYQPLEETDLTPVEINALPPRVQAYIRSLKQEIAGLQMQIDRTTRQLRRSTWGRNR